MGKLVMIILTKSSKFSAKCVAGINVENGEWVRLVSDDVEKHGAIPDYKLQTDTREVCILDVVEVPIIGRCGDLLQPENVMIDKTEKMKIIDRVTLQDVLKIHPKENGDYKYILGNPYMYVSEDTINDVHRSLTLVKVKNLIIRQVVTKKKKKKHPNESESYPIFHHARHLLLPEKNQTSCIHAALFHTVFCRFPDVFSLRED